MALGANIEEISKDALEYLKRSADGCKLRLIEGLSLLMGDIVCGFALSVLLLVALFMLIAAMVVVLVPLIGVALSMVVAALLLFAVALLVYLLRGSLFTDRVVRHFVTMFFGKERKNECEKE